MLTLRLSLTNALRNRLRTGLTVIGLAIALSAFGLVRTIVDAWYASADATSSTRLITRSSISMTFPLPQHYAQRIKAVEGVKGVSWANWFGGVYISERNFFPQYAVDPHSYLELYPEFHLSDAERSAFENDRKGAVVGRRLANLYGWKVGDTIALRGTSYPGTWSFNLRGIYDGVGTNTDEQQMLFHWKLLNEALLKRRSGNYVGWYVVGVDDPRNTAVISERVDAQFSNSAAETLTETEKAFQLGFVAMSETILSAMEAVSYVIVLIVAAVLANSMTMAARERLNEYAILRAMGFSLAFVVRLLLSESLLIALMAGCVAALLTWPIFHAVATFSSAMLPPLEISRRTFLILLGAAFVVGTSAIIWPAWTVSRTRIATGLRRAV